MEEYRRWEENIKMDIKEMGINVRNWIDSAQIGLLEIPCECGIEPSGYIIRRIS